MRRLPYLAVAAIVLFCPPASAGAQIVFDDGYDPDSPAGKQYSIPVEKVVDETSGGRAGRSGTKAQGGAGPLFGAGVTTTASGRGAGEESAPSESDSAGPTGVGNSGPGSGGGSSSSSSSAGTGADGSGSGVGGASAGERAAEQSQVLAQRTANAARAQAEGAASGVDPGLWLVAGIAGITVLAGALTLLGRVGRGSTPPPVTS